MDRVPPFPYRDLSSRGHALAMKKALDVRSDFNVILVVGEHATFPRPIIFFLFSFPFLPDRETFASNYGVISFFSFFSFFSFRILTFFDTNIETAKQRSLKCVPPLKSEGLIVNVGQVGLNLPLFINDYG